MSVEGSKKYVAFAGPAQVAAGPLRTVASAVRTQPLDPAAPVLIFDDETGEVVEVDLPETGEGEDDAGAPARGPGRPKLGVVSKEVTLLPRHWAWLAAQRGSASATLRRLIDEARHSCEGRDAVRRAQDSAYRFVSVMAGNEPTFEEAIRALYRGDAARYAAETAPWPPDVRALARKLAAAAFGPDR